MTFKTCYFKITLLIYLSSLAIARKQLRTKPTQEGGFECVTGERYQENKCNFCECKNGELVGCSRNDCDKLPFYDMATNCTIGNKWNEECNRCQCDKQYGTVCTLKSCDTDTSLSLNTSGKGGARKGRTRYTINRTQHHRLSKSRARVVQL